MGIWFYHGVMTLESRRPFLMTTRAHFVPDEAKTTIKMAQIVDQWTETATKRSKSAITVMDTYYLSNQPMQELHHNGRLVIVALNQGWFKNVELRGESSTYYSFCTQQ